MNKWNKIEEGNPKYSDYYIVYCELGNILGGYKEVRSYFYSVLNNRWIIPETNEVVSITHWMDMPDEPEEE